MLHVGLEHVGSLHVSYKLFSELKLVTDNLLSIYVSYTCIESLVSWQLNDYRLSLVFKSSLNLNL